MQISTVINSNGNVVSTFINGYFPGTPVLNYLIEITPQGAVKQLSLILD